MGDAIMRLVLTTAGTGRVTILTTLARTKAGKNLRKALKRAQDAEKKIPATGQSHRSQSGCRLPSAKATAKIFFATTIAALAYAATLTFRRRRRLPVMQRLLKEIEAARA